MPRASTLVEYATGLAYIKNCSITGNITATSRYCTHNADDHIPIPSDNAINGKIITTDNTTCGPTSARFHAIITTSIPAATAASTKHPIAPLSGNISRGKYTFDTIAEFPSNIPPILLIMFEKSCHATRLLNANKNIDTGFPFADKSIGNFARLPKTIAKIPAAISGCSTTQLTPSAVCLYRRRMSRITSDPSKSRNRHISRKSTPIHPFPGRIFRNGFAGTPAVSASVYTPSTVVVISLFAIECRTRTPGAFGRPYAHSYALTTATDESANDLRTPPRPSLTAP